MVAKVTQASTGPDSQHKAVTPKQIRKGQSKSRNGCITCKQRRTKCDETKPTCLKCAKKNLECGGYPSNYRWVNPEFPPAMPAKRRQSLALLVKMTPLLSNEQLFKEALEDAAMSVVGKSIKDLEYEKTHRQPATKKLRRSWSLSDVNGTQPETEAEAESTATPHASLVEFRSRVKSDCPPNDIPENSSTEFQSLSLVPVNSEAVSSVVSDSVGENESTPSVSETPFNKDSVAELNLTPSLSALMHQIFDPSSGKPGFNNLDPYGDPSFSPLELGSSVPEMPPLVKSEAFGKPSESWRTDLGLTHTDQNLAFTSEQEHILGLYASHTSGILSIKCGLHENPWNILYVPLAREYSFVFNSIASMTLFHLAGNAKVQSERGNLRSKGCFYMKRCILELAAGLKSVEEDSDDSSLPPDVALMTCLNLAISESWDTHTSSGIAHLKGARSLIHKVLSLIKDYMARRSELPAITPADTLIRKKLKLVDDKDWKHIEEGSLSLKEGDSQQPDFIVPKNLQLVFNKWIYLHVLSQMTVQSGQDERGIDLVATITSIIGTTHKKKIKQEQELMFMDKNDSPIHSETELHTSSNIGGFFEDFNCSFLNSDLIDPLLGCAQSLFLIMGKVASLISLVRKEKERLLKTARNSLNNIGRASELRQKLMAWKPEISTNTFMGHSADGGESWDVHSCITTAEAYRTATLLYLHQAVPEIPLPPPHQLAEKIFVLLATVPMSSNLHIIHIFPLLVSSCEATPGEERRWCESRWAFLSERLWIGNVDRAFEVVKEVWRRKDETARKKRRELEESTITMQRVHGDLHRLATDINGLMAALLEADTDQGICSRTHWNLVMKEWEWEVFLG